MTHRIDIDNHPTPERISWTLVVLAACLFVLSVCLLVGGNAILTAGG